MISYNNYAISVLGQDKWNELVKELGNKGYWNNKVKRLLKARKYK